jgi:hypothetical protein
MSDPSSPAALPPPSATISDGGVSAEHRVQVSLPIAVAPTTAGLVNSFRKPLLPIACWRIDELRFEFDSSFVLPHAAAELKHLALLWDSCQGPPMSVFGHADPVGDDEYNKALSGRRARALHAVLTRKADAWEELYSSPHGGDRWGVRSVQTMLLALGFQPGPPDGVSGPKTTQAIKAFQAADPEGSLAVDGVCGPKTRRVLFLAYMDAICTRPDGSPFVVEPSRFLGKGADPDGRGDYQGCSEFNPILVFSKAEDAELSKPANKSQRNIANATNRRVVIFLFPPGTELAAGQWPCPSAKAGTAACRAQLWKDGDARRAPQAERRTYAKSHDTVACRFYDGLARRSPCEAVRQTLMVWLFDADKQRMPHTRYELRIGSQRRTGTSNEEGLLVERNVFAPSRAVIVWGEQAPRVHDWDERTQRLNGRWSGKQKVNPESTWRYRMELFLDVSETEQEKLDGEAARRLHNLGYPPGRSLQENIAAFQADYGLPPAPWFDPPTKDALWATHREGIEKELPERVEAVPEPGVEEGQHPTGEEREHG